MLLSFNGRKEYKAISSLYGYKRRLKVLDDGLEFGSHWNDVCLAAMLLCRTAFWGNSRRDIEGGPTQEYPPATLRRIVKVINPKTGKGGCWFIVAGPPEYLLTLCRYYNSGMLWPVKENDRKHYLNEMAGAIMEAREQASQFKHEVVL